MNNKNIAQIDTALVRTYLELIYPRGVRLGTEAHLFMRLGGRPTSRRGLRSVGKILTAVVDGEHTRPELIAIRPLLFASPPASDQSGFAAGRAAPDSTAESLHSANAFFVDLDFEPVATPAQLEEAEVALRAFEWPATFVVCSGGGLHAYWVLERAAPLRTPEQRARWEGRREALRLRLSGAGPWSKADVGANGIVQPARLPGTWNRKPSREPVMATLRFTNGPRYNLSQLPKPVPKRMRGAIGIDGAVVPAADAPLSEAVVGPLAEGIKGNNCLRDLWTGHWKHTDQSGADLLFAIRLLPYLYRRWGRDQRALGTLLVEAICHYRRRACGDAKADRPDYLLRTARRAMDEFEKPRSGAKGAE